MTPEQKILADLGFNLRGEHAKYEREFQKLRAGLFDSGDYCLAWETYAYFELELAICFFLEEG